VKRLITICAVVGLIMAVTGTAQADLDIDAIVITSCKSHLDGIAPTDPWRFEVWIDLAATGDLHHIDVTLPAGGLSDFTIYDSYWEYDSNDYSSLALLQDDYPTGEYTFEFFDVATLLDSVILDYSGIDEPLNPVDFTHPGYDGETGISTDPTFTWTIDSGDGNALYMWLDNDDWYENGPVSMDTASWGPLGPLDPNHTHELEVSVINVKGLEPEPAFPTMTTVGGDEFKYGLWIEHLNEIGFTTVPEPATIALLGLGGLLLRRRKK